MEEKELIINKNTKLDKIKNKEEYTKLVIECKVKPEKLAGFTNVKELVIDGLFMEKHNINERNLDIFPIKNNIEKIVFKNIETCGKYYKGIGIYKMPHFYYLTYPNLKSVEFPDEIEYIDNLYLSYLENLEEIIFNVGFNFNYTNNIHIKSLNLKRIIIKSIDKKYTIDLDYKVNKITSISYNEYSKIITVNFYNYDIASNVKINTSNANIEYNNVLTTTANYINNGLLYIPDYITNVEEYTGSDVKIISFNMNLLKTINNKNSIIFYDRDNRNLEKIILRNNNDMQLIPEKVINIKEYGYLEKFYIEDNLLKLIFKSFDLFIDSEGNIEKIDKKIEDIQNKEKIDLNKYTANEIKEYMSYKMLLEFADENDTEYKKALEIVEDRVIKRLVKRR